MSDTHNDGTKAIPISPVQESEMSAIRNAFDRAASVIAAHSDLARDFAELRSQFDSLKHDMEYLRMRNKELDEMLVQVRQQRDEAISRANSLSDELHQVKVKNETLTNDTQAQVDTIDRLREQLDQTRKDRDQYGMEAMTAKDSLTKAEDTIAKLKATIQETADRLQGLFQAHEPKSEPAPTAYNPPTEVTMPPSEPTEGSHAPQVQPKWDDHPAEASPEPTGLPDNTPVGYQYNR